MTEKYEADLVEHDSPIIVTRDGKQVGTGHDTEHKASAVAITEKLNNPDAEVKWTQSRTIVAEVSISDEQEPAKKKEPNKEAGSNDVTVTADIGDDNRAVSVTAPPGKRVRAIYDDDGTTAPMSIMHYAGDCFIAEARYIDMLGDISVKSFKAVYKDKIFEAADFTIYSACATRPFRFQEPEALDKPDYSKLPPITGGEKQSYVDEVAKLDESNPSDVVWFHDWMGDYGERRDLGVVHDADAVAIANPTPENIHVMRVLADCSAPMIRAYIDPKTDDFVSPEDYPQITENGQSFNPKPLIYHSTKNPYERLDAAHATGFNIGADVFFDTDYDKDQMAAWALWCGALSWNWGYRLDNGKGVIGIKHVQDRTTFWLTKTLAAIADTNHRMAPLFKKWSQQVADQLDEWHSKQPDAMPWMPYGVRDGRGGGLERRAGEPWQQYYGVISIGFALARGMGMYADVAKWFARIPVESVLPVDYKQKGDIDVPYEMAVLYHVRNRDEQADVSDTNPLYKSWAKCIEMTGKIDDHVQKMIDAGTGTAALQKLNGSDDGSPNPAGAFLCYIRSSEGYYASLRCALSVCVAFNLHPGAQKAWDRVEAHDYLDHSIEPKYNWRPELP